MEDVEIAFQRDPGRIGVKVAADGAPVAEMAISEYSWDPVSHLYQSFMKDQQGAFLANITMQGEQSEHEEETGRLVLHPHLFNKDLMIAEVYEVPFRELWMRDGMQSFEPLIQLETA
jgi:hypothetical protein